MVVSTRAIAALAFGALGLGLLAAPARGQQQPTQAQDPALRKATTQAAAAQPTAPRPPAPATIGWVDMSRVFKEYDKVRVNSEEFKAAVMAKKNELMKLMAEAQTESDMLAKLTPGSVDFKKHEDRITDLKAKHEASREQYEREFTVREAEMLATLYKEIAAMVKRIADYRGMTYVLRVANDPITGANPNSAMMAIERTVVYADPRFDITNDVIHNLNREYRAAGGAPPPATTSDSRTPAPAATPAPSARPAN